MSYKILIITSDNQHLWLTKDYAKYRDFDYHTTDDANRAFKIHSFRSAQRHFELASQMYSTARTILITAS